MSKDIDVVFYSSWLEFPCRSGNSCKLQGDIPDRVHKLLVYFYLFLQSVVVLGPAHLTHGYGLKQLL